MRLFDIHHRHYHAASRERIMLTTILLLLPALAYFLAALLTPRYGWRLAMAMATLALIASLLAPLATSHPAALLAASPLNLLMSVLISLLALIVVRFSSRYLYRDAAQAHFQRWLHLCLAGVSLVVISNHLLLLWSAWVLVSCALHQLLMCYPQRFRAALAAHKKFIFARLAELCLLAGSLLLYHLYGSFQIDRIVAALEANSGTQLAALLFALAALIKCAQLPLHGWLIQVVEAPTPVSALLHAGVINLGGYLLILLAPLLALSAPAQWLLLLVAGSTTVLAALVMTTRISIKVRLAWSTSAQMGLMLVECALGLTELALLHLIAHSAYKAHAFLGSGDAVLQSLARRFAGPASGQLNRTALASGFSTLVLLFVITGLPSAAELSLWWLFALAMVCSSRTTLPGNRLWLPLAMVLAPLAYYLQKTALAGVLPVITDAGVVAALWVAALALMLVLGDALTRLPHPAWRQRWHQWLFAGFYLDEWVTRLTLALWPVNLPRQSHEQSPASRFTPATELS